VRDYRSLVERRLARARGESQRCTVVIKDREIRVSVLFAIVLALRQASSIRLSVDARENSKNSRFARQNLIA
jgi:hypothetical protein